MTITNRDGLTAAIIAGQRITWQKSGGRTTSAAIPFSAFDVAGQPGAGVLAGTSVAAGVVPTDATAGCPTINAFGGGARGAISNFTFGANLPCRLRMYDMLFKAGAYPFNAAQTLAAQPSYSSRVPGGTDFNGTQIWIECVTTFTGNLNIAVTYTDQSGNAGHTTGTVATGFVPIVGRMTQLPLQAGDGGVQKIETVTSTIATVGTFNVLVLRPLAGGRVRVANDSGIMGPDQTGLVEIFADSAVIVTAAMDSTALGIVEVSFDVVNG